MPGDARHEGDSKTVTELARKLIPLPPAKNGSSSQNVAVVPYEYPAKQRDMVMVARGPQFGYALNQMNTCRRYRCDPPHASEGSCVFCGTGHEYPPQLQP